MEQVVLGLHQIIKLRCEQKECRSIALHVLTVYSRHIYYSQMLTLMTHSHDSLKLCLCFFRLSFFTLHRPRNLQELLPAYTSNPVLGI